MKRTLHLNQTSDPCQRTWGSTPGLFQRGVFACIWSSRAWSWHFLLRWLHGTNIFCCFWLLWSKSSKKRLPWGPHTSLTVAHRVSRSTHMNAWQLNDKMWTGRTAKKDKHPNLSGVFFNFINISWNFKGIFAHFWTLMHNMKGMRYIFSTT